MQIDDRKSDMAQWNLAFLRAQFLVQLFSTMYHVTEDSRLKYENCTVFLKLMPALFKLFFLELVKKAIIFIISLSKYLKRNG